MASLAVIQDAPGETLAEKIGFTRAWELSRARSWLEVSAAHRRAGNRRSAALHLAFAGECRRDAAALVRRA